MTTGKDFEPKTFTTEEMRLRDEFIASKLPMRKRLSEYLGKLLLAKLPKTQ